VTPSVVSSTTGHAQRRFDVRNTAHSTFKDMQVRQSREPFCSSDKFHPLSAAWAKRWRRRGIVSVFVAHKRNSVFEPLAKWDRYITGELLRGYWEIAERLIFGNRRSPPPFLQLRTIPRNCEGGIDTYPSILEKICAHILRGRGQAIFAAHPHRWRNSRMLARCTD
jgi:hypothetical protein